MTSFAFILGCVPLWTASGAGAIAREIIGTTVIGGMVAETFIGRVFVPAIFVVVEKLSGAKALANGGGPVPCPAQGEGDASVVSLYHHPSRVPCPARRPQTRPPP